MKEMLAVEVVSREEQILDVSSAMMFCARPGRRTALPSLPLILTRALLPCVSHTQPFSQQFVPTVENQHPGGCLSDPQM